MCGNFGYSFKYRSTKPAKMTKKLDKICSVTGKDELNLSQINEIGRHVNEDIFTRFDKESNSIIINGNDKNINAIWKQY